jgi:hypothetical protein
MDLTTALTGMLPFIVVISTVLTAIGASLLFGLYGRAVLRSMNVSSGLRAPPRQPQGPKVQSGSSGLTGLKCT